MSYQIITDTACDYPAHMYEELGLTSVPLTVLYKGESYTQYSEQWLKELFDGLRAGETATTSAINPDGWASAMEQVLQQYLGISLAQSEKDGIDSFRYYSGTDVYFSFNNGFEGLGNDFQVYFVQEVDGCYEVFYNRDGRYRITLQLVDGVFRILSNVAI